MCPQKRNGLALTCYLGGEQVAALERVDDSEGLEGSMVIPHKGVHAQESHQPKVAKHAHHIRPLIISLCLVEVLHATCMQVQKHLQ